MYHAHQSLSKSDTIPAPPISFLSSVWIDQPAIFSPTFQKESVTVPKNPWVSVPSPLVAAPKPQLRLRPSSPPTVQTKHASFAKQQQAKQLRKAKAEETLSILRHGSYSTSVGTFHNISDVLKSSVENTKTLTPEHRFTPVTNRFSVMEVEVTLETTMRAAKRLWEEVGSGVGCLCFASAKNPGGAFLGGSDGQEESIARGSGYYHCVMKDTTLYDHNRSHKDPFHSDHIIVAPDTPVFRSESSPYMLTAPWKLTVIAAPAVNANLVRERNIPNATVAIAQRMRQRVNRILGAAYEAGVTHLVLGEYGCGTLGNDPYEIAYYFKQALMFPDSPFAGAFQHVVFAITEDATRCRVPCMPSFVALGIWGSLPVDSPAPIRFRLIVSK